MHFLGDDIRNKTLEELEYRKKFDALIVGSYAATRWVPDATAVVPPGLDLRLYEPVPAVERERPLVVHAPSDLEKKGTRFVVEACKQLPVDLDVVHGVPHDEAVERFKRADIVVDQMHYLWHGVFAIESMAYGKPVVTHLDAEAVRQTEEAFGLKVPDRGRDERRSRGKAATAGRLVRAAQAARGGGPRLRGTRPQPGQGRGPVHRDLPHAALDTSQGLSLGHVHTENAMLQRLKELLRHSAIYGLGSIVARVLAVLLLPLYTRYLSPTDYGLIETLVALSAVLTALVAQAMKSAFFRFYFDSAEPEDRLLVVRTTFWYVLAASTAVLVAGVAFAQQISWLLFDTRSHDGLVIAAFIGLWAAMNYEQMTSLFRVEQRSGAYVVATLANVAITIAATVLLVVASTRARSASSSATSPARWSSTRRCSSTAGTPSASSSTAPSTAR